MDFRQQVLEWIATLNAAEMRLLTTTVRDTLLPDGRRLRAIPICKDCWFGRDRKFWGYIDGSDQIQQLTLEDVGARTTMRDILSAYYKARQEARQREPRLYQYVYGD
jgi:hypothetical protein